MQVRNQVIDNINYDLQLIRLLGGQKGPDYQRPKNLRQLSQILRLKNPPDLYREDQLQRGKQWLARKGIELDISTSRDMMPESSSTATPKEQDSYFYLSLSEKNVEEYRVKAYENAAMNALQAAMGMGQYRKKANKRLMERV